MSTKLTYQRGWWYVTLAGSLLLALALLCGWIFLLRPADSRAPFLTLGLVLAGAGGVMLTLRHGVTFDREANLAVRWWGPLFPVIRIKRPLADFDRVNMVEKTVREGNVERTHYEVYLEDNDGRKPALPIDRFAEYRRARKTSEFIAKGLEMSMAELARGRKLLRDHRHLDESIRDRMNRLGRDIPCCQAPAKTRSSAVIAAGECRVEIPAAGNFHLSVREILAIAAIGALALAGYAGLAVFAGVSHLFALPVLAAPAVIFLAAGFLTRHRHSTRIIASPGEFRVEETDIFGVAVRRLPADDIEEFELNTRSRHRGLIAVSDERTIHFAAGLPDDELKYLHFQLLKCLIESEQGIHQ